MPVILGFILGVLVTIGCAYQYDASTGRAANGLTATASGGQAPMVNWDVVSQDWQKFETGVRGRADALERRLTRHTG